jgi:ubiquinone/menaquinone biosynthesis C-methylase UbiE
MMVTLWILLAFVALRIVVNLGWRLASRMWSLPCPTAFAWVLENPGCQRLLGTATTLDRIGIRPGQRIVEFGPGPGRLLIPAARRVLPGGEVIGIDLQQGMLDRLTRYAAQQGIVNVTTIHGDATRSHLPANSCDLAMLCEVLGEIPDRAAVLAQCFQALKPGGMLSVTESLIDPHYQFQSTLKRFARRAGFRLQSIQGGRWLYTANFIKPATGLTRAGPG